MRILWWNVQRLGLTTDEARKAGINSCRERWGVPPEVGIFCELTTAAGEPAPLQYVYRRKNKSQLCYGVISGTDAPAPAVERFTPERGAACYRAAGNLGGTYFDKLTNRAPGLTSVEGKPVYFFHAPANSDKAARTIAFLACDLAARHGDDPWVLLGDLNVEPDDLLQQQVGVDLRNLIKPPDKATFHTGKKYDYALSNIEELVVWAGPRYGLSDHNPILVSDRRGVKQI